MRFPWNFVNLVSCRKKVATSKKFFCCSSCGSHIVRRPSEVTSKNVCFLDLGEIRRIKKSWCQQVEKEIRCFVSSQTYCLSLKLFFGNSGNRKLIPGKKWEITIFFSYVDKEFFMGKRAKLSESLSFDGKICFFFLWMNNLLGGFSNL